MKHLSHQIVVIALLVFLGACSGPEKRSDTEDSLGSASVSVSQQDKEKFAQATKALQNGELGIAESAFKELVLLKPGLSGPYANLGLIYLKQNKPQQALDYINKAIKRNTNNAQSFNVRAQIQVQLGHIHQAKDDYLNAIKLKPDYVNAHYNLALLYDIYLQEIALAIEYYETYLSLLKQPDQATQEWISQLKGSLNNG